MKKQLALAGIGACLSVSAFADNFITNPDIIYDSGATLVWAPIVTLSAGPSWGTAGQNQYLYPNPAPQFNYYTYNSPTSTMANLEFFFGLQQLLWPYIIGELGLGAAGVSDGKVTGAINVNGAPNALTYSYKVNHARIDLKGRMIADFGKPVQPYISGSIGAGFNNAHDFLPVSSNPTLYPNTWFTSNTTVAFPYTVGAGIQTKLNPNWQVGIGYEFADLGKSYLGVSDTNLPKGPKLTHFYTNELLFSVSYLFR